MKLLLEKPEIDINKSNNNGKTPFFHACKKDKIKIV